MNFGKSLHYAISATLLIGPLLLGPSSSSLQAADQEVSRPQAASPDAMTAERWTRDLDVLAAELPRRHKNLYFQISEADFKQRSSPYALLV